MKTWLIFVLALGTAGIVTAAPAPAEACGNSMHRMRERRPAMAIRTATRLIAADNHREAISTLARQFKTLQADADDLENVLGHERLAVHIAAVAIVRSQGRLSLTADPQAIEGAEATANLMWASKVLEAMAPTNPAARAHLAELTAADPGRRAEARIALEALADAGQLDEAFSWRLLATLRSEHGDRDGSVTAMARADEIGTDLSFLEPANQPRSRSKSRSKR